MFTGQEHEALRTQLIGFARDDAWVVAAAVLGSAARGELDRWSEVDPALRLAPGVEAWTELVAQSEPVVDHLDLHASGALYRVFDLSADLAGVVGELARPKQGPTS